MTTRTRSVDIRRWESPPVYRRIGLALAMLVALSGFVGEVHAQDLHELFLGPVYPAGCRMIGMRSADVDGDSLLDLITVDNDLQTGSVFGQIAVMYGSGNGTFSPRVSIDIGMEPNDAAVADFNGDGFVDFAAAARLWTYVVPGRDDGTFGERVLGPLTEPTCHGFYLIEAVHLNQDSLPDLLATATNCSDAGWGTVAMLATGDESFFEVSEILDGGAVLAPGDFDQDGKMDVVVRLSGSLQVYGGLGDGTFHPPQVLPGSASGSAFGAPSAVGDFNLDGRPDLAFRDGANGIGVLLNTGNGFFESELAFETTTSLQFVDSLTAGDLDGDGDDDLFATYRSTSCQVVLLSNGDGTFAPEVCYQTLIAGGFGARLGDFDGRNGVDVAIGSWAGSSGFDLEKGSNSAGVVHVLFGNGQGGFAPTGFPPEFPLGRGARAVVLDDFDQDGVLDTAIAREQTNDVSVLIGTGDGAFAPAVAFAAGLAPVAMSVGEVNGDASADLVVANRDSGDLSLLLGSGDGSFLAGPVVSISGTPRDLALADLDGNETTDVAVAVNQEVAVFSGNGDGTFVAPVMYAVSGFPSQVIAAELGNGPALDLAVVYGVQNNERLPYMSVLFGNGDGSFATEDQIPVSPAWHRAVAAGDLDADGDNDLILGSSDEARLSVLLNEGNATFSAPILVHDVVGLVTDLALRDVNGDDRLDIVIGFRGSAYVSIALGTTEPAVFDVVSFAVWSGEGVVATGDLDLDGKIDLVHAAAVDRESVTVLLNQSPLAIRFDPDSTTLTWPLTVGSDSYDVYRGDLIDLQDADDDGQPDGGYGVCVNDLDDDTTDNVFVDTAIPAEGTGFFYLMARIPGPTDGGLGSASDGQPRIPAEPCAGHSTRTAKRGGRR